MSRISNELNKIIVGWPISRTVEDKSSPFKTMWGCFLFLVRGTTILIFLLQFNFHLTFDIYTISGLGLQYSNI